MRRSARLVVFSGAGLSAESGLPTFRGADGLWEGVPIRQVCHIETWRDNFDAVHEFYDARRLAVGAVAPNAAHRAIAAWQQRWPNRTHLLTQNVDGLLEAAGCNGVIHLHGEVRKLRCLACGHEWEIPYVPYDRAGCPACGRREDVKPAIVFFGETAPRYREMHALVAGLRPEDTALVVGTSGFVLPADQLFGSSPAHSILVNLEPGTAMDESAFTERFYGPATQILPGLTESLRLRME